MVLSERLVREYQKTYKRKFNKDIPPKEAERELLDLTGLVRLIIRGRRSRHGK